MTNDRTSMENGHQGPERRNFARKSFMPGKRPVLKIDKVEYEILDISDQGLKLLNDKKIKLKGWISGRLKYPDNRYVDIDGIVVRKSKYAIGLHLVEPIQP